MENYPEKIYCTYSPYSEEDVGKLGGIWTESPIGKGIAKDVEYIRIDQARQSNDESYKRGMVHGYIGCQLKRWHKYPEEKPKELNKPYLVTICRDGESWVNILYFDKDEFRSINVVAWMELPESYKED